MARIATQQSVGSGTIQCTETTGRHDNDPRGLGGKYPEYRKFECLGLLSIVHLLIFFSIMLVTYIKVYPCGLGANFNYRLQAEYYRVPMLVGLLGLLLHRIKIHRYRFLLLC